MRVCINARKYRFHDLSIFPLKNLPRCARWARFIKICMVLIYIYIVYNCCYTRTKYNDQLNNDFLKYLCVHDCTHNSYPYIEQLKHSAQRFTERSYYCVRWFIASYRKRSLYVKIPLK